MKDSPLGNPVGGQPVHPLPRKAIFLVTPPQRAQPNTLNMVVECFQRGSVGRHCVVGEEASDYLLFYCHIDFVVSEQRLTRSRGGSDRMRHMPNHPHDLMPFGVLGPPGRGALRFTPLTKSVS
jgi:hypothetical protein